MNSKKIYLRLLLAFFVWASLSAIGLFHGIKLIKTLEPYYIEVIETAYPQYKAKIEYEEDNLEPYVVLWVTALKPIEYAPQKFLEAGRSVGPTKVTVLHTMVPLVIFGVIVLVWPVKSLTEFAILIALAVPGALLVTGITSPFQMLGLLDTAFIQAAAQEGYVYKSQAFNWMQFTEGGARWLIPILVGIICARLASWLAPKPKVD